MIEIVIGEHQGHEILLFDTDAMLTRQHSPGGERRRDDLGARGEYPLTSPLDPPVDRR